MSNQGVDMEHTAIKRVKAYARLLDGQIKPSYIADTKPVNNAMPSVEVMIIPNDQFEKLEALNRGLVEAVRGIIEIGRKDTSNPKYDGYYISAVQALAHAEEYEKGTSHE